MKLIYAGFVSLLICASSLIWAQDTETEVIIPTEVSEPPYEVGDLISDDGYSIDLGEEKSINFRIVGNKIRIYWLDENKLIMKPPATGAIVRIPNISGGGRVYNYAEPLSEDVGLGSPAFIPPPHIFNVILTIQPYADASESEMTTYSFRYSPDMNPSSQE